MKMRTKILATALLPLICLGIIIVGVANTQINKVVSASIKNGLRATAVSVRDTLSYTEIGGGITT